MDPNEALETLREAYLEANEYDQVGAVLETFNALDEWITNGGFLPDDWQEVI